jgi:hypothetical protein
MEGSIRIEAPQGSIVLDAKSIEFSSSGTTKLVAKGGLALDGRPGDTTLQGATVNIN